MSLAAEQEQGVVQQGTDPRSGLSCTALQRRSTKDWSGIRDGASGNPILKHWNTELINQGQFWEQFPFFSPLLLTLWFFWPLTSPYERHFRWMLKTWLISALCFCSPASAIIERERWAVLLLLAKYLQSTLDIITSMLKRWRRRSELEHVAIRTAAWLFKCLFGSSSRAILQEGEGRWAGIGRNQLLELSVIWMWLCVIGSYESGEEVC